jgi:hypothetical protein
LKQIEVNCVAPRHSVDQDHVKRLKESMSQNGWLGCPLLIVNRNPSHDIQDYEVLTGTHRSAAAMELGIPIPVLVLEQNDLPVCFSLDMDHRDYEQLFREAGLTIPAELMARELKFGGTKNYRQPTPKDPRGAGKIRVKRIKSND